MIVTLVCAALLAQDVPVPPPAAQPVPAAPVETTPASAPASIPAATDVPPVEPAPTDPKLALDEVLERAGMESVNVLEREVKSLQQTLDGLVLADGESNMKILGARGAEDDLESFGVDDAVARQVRRLLDEVRSNRAKLALLDLRGGSLHNPIEGVRPATDAAAAPEPKVQAPPTLPAEDAAADVLAGPSPDPQRECAIAYRDRDVKTVLAMLADVPVVRMKAETQWIFGTCLMSERRFADAKSVFALLQNDADHAHLANAAKQQLQRIEFLENGLVGQGPAKETKK